MDPAHRPRPALGCLLRSAQLLQSELLVPVGLRRQRWGSSPLLLRHSVMGTSGQPGEPLLTGTQEGAWSASSTPRHTHVDFSGQPDNCCSECGGISICD